VLFYITSVYPAKSQPGSESTKLDSEAQKRLRRSRIKGYGTRPRPARGWPVPLSYHRPAHRRAGDFELAGNCTRQLSWPARTFSKWAILHRFSNFYTLRVEIFQMFLIRSRLPMTPMNHEKLHGNRSARFSEIQKTDTHTDAAALYIFKKLH